MCVVVWEETWMTIPDPEFLRILNLLSHGRISTEAQEENVDGLRLNLWGIKLPLSLMMRKQDSLLIDRGSWPKTLLVQVLGFLMGRSVAETVAGTHVCSPLSIVMDVDTQWQWGKFPFHSLTAVR